MAIAGAAAIGLALALAIARRRSPWARYAGGWAIWAALALASAAVFPAGCYLFVVPSLVAGLALVAAARAPERARLVILALPAYVAATMWFEVAMGLRDALSLDGHAAIALAIALPLIAALPIAELKTRLRYLPLLVGAAALAAGAAGAFG